MIESIDKRIKLNISKLNKISNKHYELRGDGINHILVKVDKDNYPSSLRTLVIAKRKHQLNRVIKGILRYQKIENNTLKVIRE